MKLLLDTHVVLWTLSTPRRIPSSVRAILEDRQHDLWISIASFWELRIKVASGKLDLPPEFHGEVAALGARYLSIELSHIETATSLPPIHRDPFDRMLIGQYDVPTSRA